MKQILKFILLIFILAFNQIDAQENEKLYGTWISKNNDVLTIKGEHYNFNVMSTISRESQLKIKIQKDTLRFYSVYTSSRENFKVEHLEKYDFKIENIDKAFLILRPLDSLSQNFFNTKESIKFVKQEYNIDKSINFEKVIFHSTRCYGTCPIIALEIDKDRNIYLDIKHYSDSSKNGQFEGKLTQKEYNSLLKILETSNIKSWEFPEIMGADAPIRTIILYYNGIRKYFKSMFPPTVSYELIGFLRNITDSPQLIKTNIKRKLEE